MLVNCIVADNRARGGNGGKTYYYSVTAVGASSESGFSAFVAGKR